MLRRQSGQDRVVLLGVRVRLFFFLTLFGSSVCAHGLKVTTRSTSARSNTEDSMVSANVADLDTDPECPGAFVGWLAQALERHRAQVCARKSFNKAHVLPASTNTAVEDAIVANRQELGRVVVRSAFAREAVIAASGGGPPERLGAIRYASQDRTVRPRGRRPYMSVPCRP